jgi:stringent starvation protein B
MINALESSSTRPYLIRALYEWCTDNGFTPYVAVLVDETVQVPREYVKNGEIVLNISFDATSSLKLGNDFIEFKARFAGTAREINVPVGRVIAIYARENGQGMAFPAPGQPAAEKKGTQGALSITDAVGGRPSLRDAQRGDGGSDTKIMHLVTGDELSGTRGTEQEAPTDQEDPPRPPAGAGAKPSLKRIK